MQTHQRRVVLYIEDDEAYVGLLRRALQRSRIENLPDLRVLPTVEAAIAYLAGEPPYESRLANPLPVLVVTDLRLPGKTGLELVRWIRQQPECSALPVVMLSGSALDKDIETAYDMGVNFCLLKPIDAEALISVVLALSVYWIPPPTRTNRV